MFFFKHRTGNTLWHEDHMTFFFFCDRYSLKVVTHKFFLHAPNIFQLHLGLEGFELIKNRKKKVILGPRNNGTQYLKFPFPSSATF